MTHNIKSNDQNKFKNNIPFETYKCNIYKVNVYIYIYIYMADDDS